MNNWIDSKTNVGISSSMRPPTAFLSFLRTFVFLLIRILKNEVRIFCPIYLINSEINFYLQEDC